MALIRLTLKCTDTGHMYLTQKSKLRRWNWKRSESRKTKTVKWNLTWKFSRWCDDGVKNVEFITRTFSWYWVGMKDDHVISSESVEAGLGGRSENLWGQDLLLNLPKKGKCLPDQPALQWWRKCINTLTYLILDTSSLVYWFMSFCPAARFFSM